jgi:hypothetical protein
MRESVHVKNARAMKALGIETIAYTRQNRMLAVWSVTLSSGESFEIETPGLGT